MTFVFFLPSGEQLHRATQSLKCNCHGTWLQLTQLGQVESQSTCRESPDRCARLSDKKYVIASGISVPDRAN
jgi:hypothetical protein